MGFDTSLYKILNIFIIMYYFRSLSKIKTVEVDLNIFCSLMLNHVLEKVKRNDIIIVNNGGSVVWTLKLKKLCGHSQWHGICWSQYGWLREHAQLITLNSWFERQFDWMIWWTQVINFKGYFIYWIKKLQICMRNKTRLNLI